MVCSNHWKIDKIDKLFICLLLIFICIFEFCNTFVFASQTETIETSRIADISISPASNFFQSGGSVGYVEMQSGYIYNVFFEDSGTGTRNLAISSSLPELYGEYSYLGSLEPGESFSYICYDTSNYLYFDFSWYSSKIIVTREPIPSFNSAIDGLVNNVGIDNIWSIFDISVNYILVVVLFSIGVFLIISFIKKGSKGKSVF